MLSDTIFTSLHPDSWIVWLSCNKFTRLPLNYWDACNVHSCTMPCSVLPLSGEWASLPNHNTVIFEQCNDLGRYPSLLKLWDELLIF